MGETVYHLSLHKELTFWCEKSSKVHLVAKERGDICNSCDLNSTNN